MKPQIPLSCRMGLSLGLLMLLHSATSHNLTKPCPSSGANCFCDKLPEVYCTGLSEIPAALPDPSAKAVVFDECNFNVLRPQNLTAYVSLERLAVTNSHVTLIEAYTFDAMTNMKSLDLSYNNLHQGPQTFTGPRQLQELLLKGNNLIVTPNVADLEELERLWLSENSNMQFDTKHLMPKSLRELYLDHCKLFVVPPAIFLNAIRYIKVFNLDYNFLTVLDNTQFVYMNDVETLSLEHNVLRQISEHAFEGMHKIRNLRLGYNNISYLDDETFETFDNDLEILTLNNNRLQSLSEKAVGTRKNLREIHLGSNPWNCDCGVHWMRDLSEELVVDNDDFTCVTPEHVKDWAVQNVTSTLSCDPPNKGFLITITVIIVVGCLVLIGIAIFFIYKKKKEQAAASQRAQGVKYSEVYRDPTERSHR